MSGNHARQKYRRRYAVLEEWEKSLIIREHMLSPPIININIPVPTADKTTQTAPEEYLESTVKNEVWLPDVDIVVSEPPKYSTFDVSRSQVMAEYPLSAACKSMSTYETGFVSTESISPSTFNVSSETKRNTKATRVSCFCF